MSSIDLKYGEKRLTVHCDDDNDDGMEMEMTIFVGSVTVTLNVTYFDFFE